eukprot:CAMPEP_0183745746 /NCGR_PEP_ID=MMETSP0737-20130205/66402_1 /TAXON_ID=385413 /ORGANISM="Thalassiosira miniscula, Strain CCMP1093" /LENGTH=775 /DNA_ID=CAMNT_0025981425 /DNA_START=130 /DNA_END=2457 /DNA_ORIENTATION=+
MKTATLLSHIAIFLSGVFIALLVSTSYIAKINDSSARAGISPGTNDFVVSAGTRGGSSLSSSAAAAASNEGTEIEGLKKAAKDYARSLHEERQKTHELQKQLSKLQQNNGAGASSESTTATDDDIEGSLRERLLQSFQTQYNKIHKGTDICSILPQPTPTSLSLWSHHLPHIFNATKHSADHPEYIFHDFTALLLHFMTPDRLQRSVKTLPLDWTPVERSLDVLYRRWKAVQTEVNAYQKSNNLPPDQPIPEAAMKHINGKLHLPRKLNILVMGGSVTMGVVCHINPVTTATGKYSRRNCAWPGRVATFFSSLFGGYELVEFHTLALGGTNTESGITMWDYSLLPGDVPYPDIVINAYATNDMHYNSVQDAIAKNITLGTSVFQLSQAFVRQVLTPKRGCGHAPPLLLYLDDYLGNEQNEVMTTLLSSQTINLISGYYGIASMSYGDAVRDMVYGDTNEWCFSSKWWEGGAYQRAVHPHMGMHISMVWIVAFNLMNLMTTYCSLPESDHEHSPKHQIHRRNHAGVQSTSDGTWDYGYRPIDGLPTLRKEKELEGGPKAKPRGIPPPLTDELSLEHITQEWKKDGDSNAHLWNTLKECIDLGHANDDVGHETLPKPCIYSWVANLERKLDNPKRLTDKLKPFVTANEGWSAADDNNKLGWVPSSGLNSKFTMEFKSISHPVRAVTWMIMRSYGEKWEGSTLRVQVFSGGTLLASKDIVGFHDKKTSETYNIKMRLDDGTSGGSGGGGAVLGSDLKITFQLVGGTTFKISGMAICDH